MKIRLLIFGAVIAAGAVAAFLVLKTSQPGFHYTISDASHCTTDPRPADSACETLQKLLVEKSVSVASVAGGFSFQTAQYSYCSTVGGNWTMTLERSENSLLVKQTLQAESVTRCSAPYIFEGRITNLKKGIYSLLVVVDNQYAESTSRYPEVSVTVP